MSVKSLISNTVDGLGLPEEKALAFKEALEALLASAAPETEEKAWVPLVGSMEATRDACRVAIESWAEVAVGARDEENDWYVSIEGTFEDSVVATIRVWKGEGTGGTYRWPYVEAEDGAITLGDAEEVVIQATVTVGTSAATTEDGTAVGTVESAASIEADDEKAADLAAAMETVEEIGAETKAGRVLSEANATRLAEAMETIRKVLAAAQKPKADETEKPKDEKVLARTVQPKGAEVTVQVKAPEVPDGFEALDQKDLLELVLLSES